MPAKHMVYTCSKCDAQFPKWSGRCPACGAWASINQIPQEQISEQKITSPLFGQAVETTSFKEGLQTSQAALHPTYYPELDVVLGGGLVEGSVTLIAGEPGIGKSTFLAQLGLRLSSENRHVVYVTGEESPAQVSRRLTRLSPTLPESLHFFDRTDANMIAVMIEKDRPDLTIIDSIQSLTTEKAPGEAGSITQVKACAAIVTEAAKRVGRPVMMIGQVTKEGEMAGPRLLEHLVDTVLFLEGDHLHRYRLLRALKHRFGSTDEVALLAMTEKGLEAVKDVSTELLHERPEGVAGSVVTSLLEGHRAILLEIQALVSSAGYGTPIRRTTGIDPARLGMLLAVLARRAGVQALDKDVYANAAGGIDARDPSVDLAVAAAITSAVRDTPLDPHLALFGEIGLAGELRPVALTEARLKELQRLGFTQIIVPKGQGKQVSKDMEIKEATTLREALQMTRVV